MSHNTCASDNLSSVIKSIQPEENNDTYITCYGVEITSNTIKMWKEKIIASSPKELCVVITSSLDYQSVLRIWRGRLTDNHHHHLFLWSPHRLFYRNHHLLLHQEFWTCGFQHCFVCHVLLQVPFLVVNPPEEIHKGTQNQSIWLSPTYKLRLIAMVTCVVCDLELAILQPISAAWTSGLYIAIIRAQRDV